MPLVLCLMFFLKNTSAVEVSSIDGLIIAHFEQKTLSIQLLSFKTLSSGGSVAKSGTGAGEKKGCGEGIAGREGGESRGGCGGGKGGGAVKFMKLDSLYTDVAGWCKLDFTNFFNFYMWWSFDNDTFTFRQNFWLGNTPL